MKAWLVVCTLAAFCALAVPCALVVVAERPTIHRLQLPPPRCMP